MRSSSRPSAGRFASAVTLPPETIACAHPAHGVRRLEVTHACLDTARV